MLLLVLLLTIADAFDVSTPDKSVIEKTIKRVFGDEDIALVHDGLSNDLMPTMLTNPVVVFDGRTSKSPNKPNYVIFTNHDNVLLRLLRATSKTPYIPPNLKIVVVTTSANPQAIFAKLLLFKDAVVIVGRRVFKQKLNGCEYDGRVSIDILELKDDEHFSNDFNFTNCELQVYSKVNLTYSKDIVISNNVSYFLVKGIAERLKMRLNASDRFTSMGTFFVEQQYMRHSRSSVEACTKFFIEEGYVWTVPPPKRIPQIEILKLVFKKEMWIFVGAAFFITSIVWWLMNKYSTNASPISFGLSFLRVFGITILGAVDAGPRGAPLCLLFVAYVIYAIHFQTAFTSNLINLLTVPQYEPKIENLEQLSRSNLPLVTLPKELTLIRSMEQTTKTRQIIKSRIREWDYENISVQDSFAEFSIYLHEDDMRSLSLGMKIEIHYFSDSSMIGMNHLVYGVKSGRAFVKVMRKQVERFIETGMIDKKTREVKHMKKKHEHLLNRIDLGDGFPKVLTMSHVFVIFLIWGVGIALAAIVFALEILMRVKKLHKKR